MHTSEKTDLISAAFVDAHALFPVIAKDKFNPHFGSKFADLASVRQAIRPILDAHELAILQPWTAQGAVVHVQTWLLHKSGQYFQDISSAEAKNASAQAVAAAVTFICRYALVEMLDLSVSGDDDDGNSTKKDDGAQSHSEPTPDDIYDPKADLEDLRGELKHRNVPEAKWPAIEKWMIGKQRNQISRAIASA